MSKYLNPSTLSTSFSEIRKSAKKRFDNILNTKVKKTGVLAFVLILILVIIGTMVVYNGNDYIYKSEKLGFSLEIPANWDGKYDIEENENSISVYHKGIRKKYGEGTGNLFYVERLEGILSQEQIEEPGNRFMVLQANGYTYVFGMPTDVQYPIWDGGDKVLADDYVKLSENLDIIKKSIKSIAISASVPLSNVKELYDFKDTYVGDTSKVSNINNSLNFVELPFNSIELRTDNPPYGIVVNYKVDTRAKYRFLDYRNFDKTAAVIFALIPNADEIYVRVYDNYGMVDNAETSFASFYCGRQNISERSEMEYFTDENIKNATKSLEAFTQYFDKVTELKPYSYGSVGNAQETAIYSAIGDDCEILVNSGLQNFVTITKEIAGNKKINKLLVPMNIKLGEYIGKKIEFFTYGIRNFKTNQDTSYLFVFDGEKLICYKDLKTWEADRTVMDMLRKFADKGN